MCMSMLLCCSVTCWRDFYWAVCIYKNPMVLFLIFHNHFYFQLSREHSDMIYIFLVPCQGAQPIGNILLIFLMRTKLLFMTGIFE